MSAPSSDVCVIGGGVIGLAAAVSLCDRGFDVVCFESAVPGDGQSAGRTRQFRHLHREPELIELATRARTGWIEWGERFGRTLLGAEGALRVGAGPSELEALRAAGVPATVLNPAEAREHFPIADLASGVVLFDPLAGAIRAQEAIAALAGHLGRRLRVARVSSVAVDGESVTVSTDAGVHRSARCVVAAGAGTDRLARPLGLDVHQYRQAHLRLGFRVNQPSAAPLPCFSDRTGDPELIYAVSDLGDRYAVGLAEITTYPPVEDLAGEVPAGVDVSSQSERIVAYVRRRLPGLDPAPVDEVFRLTTTTPDHPEDGFRVWQAGPVAAVAGPNLFKFAPVIGEQLARAVSDEPLTGDVPLSAARGTPPAPNR